MSGRRGLMPRKTYVRDATLFVIATEGEKTEEQYFRMYKSSHIHVEVLPTGSDGLSAPKHVLTRLLDYRANGDYEPDDEFWIVVDTDSIRPQFLDEVSRDARDAGCNVAFSNPCFEIWLLLHFADFSLQAVNCEIVENAIRGRLGAYNKSNIDLASFVRTGVESAISRARNLDTANNALWPTSTGTHVYKLAERILPLIPKAVLKSN